MKWSGFCNEIDKDTLAGFAGGKGIGCFFPQAYYHGYCYLTSMVQIRAHMLND